MDLVNETLTLAGGNNPKYAEKQVTHYPILTLSLIFLNLQALDILTTALWFSKAGTKAELNGLAKWLMFIPGGPYVAKGIVMSAVLSAALLYFAKYPKFRRRALILLTCLCLIGPVNNALQMWFFGIG
jgi:hypothetical protein